VIVPASDSFTELDLDLFELLEAGLSTREIAACLVISPFTVKRHTISLYQKLQVHDRRQAVERARVVTLLPARTASSRGDIDMACVH